MKTEIDPGHEYELLTLDGELRQTLTFVKRHDPEHPERFPGNTDSHAGTTLQSVIRCLMDRVEFLDNQIPCKENILVRDKLAECLWQLEQRAARRHGHDFKLTIYDVRTMPMCPHCGHVICEKLGNAQ